MSVFLTSFLQGCQLDCQEPYRIFVATFSSPTLSVGIFVSAKRAHENRDAPTELAQSRSVATRLAARAATPPGHHSPNDELHARPARRARLPPTARARPAWDKIPAPGARLSPHARLTARSPSAVRRSAHAKARARSNATPARLALFEMRHIAHAEGLFIRKNNDIEDAACTPVLMYCRAQCAPRSPGRGSKGKGVRTPRRAIRHLGLIRGEGFA
jgi:hypothetical protein